MTQEYVLRAMAKNYSGGHSWDHLDSEACTRAADEIADLRARLPKETALSKAITALCDDDTPQERDRVRGIFAALAAVGLYVTDTPQVSNGEG